jgi:hypothetical protein
MLRGSLTVNWTQEDRLAHARWMRGVAVFYGLIALALFGVIAFSQLRSGSSTDLWASGHADAGKPWKCQPTYPGASC